MELRIAENIRKFRKAHSLTQEQLSEVLDVTARAVSKWELGLSMPDIQLIVKMADFFGTSVDVLLGYRWQSGGVDEALAQIKASRKTKDYETGREAAEKALQRYPNFFDIAYQSALLYQMIGLERKDNRSLLRAITLYQRACELMEQNTDDTISETALQIRIAETYIELGQTDKAIALLKKYNHNGMNNSLIGFTLAAVARKPDEALPVLSEALCSVLSELSQICLGYANAYGERGEFALALDAILWYREFLLGMKPQSRVTILDKLEATLLACCANIAMDQKDQAGTYEYLRQAICLAKHFDEAPDYHLEHLKFCHGTEDATVFENIGVTALEGVKSNFLQSDNDTTANTKRRIWEEFMHET